MPGGTSAAARVIANLPRRHISKQYRSGPLSSRRLARRRISTTNDQNIRHHDPRGRSRRRRSKCWRVAPSRRTIGKRRSKANALWQSFCAFAPADRGAGAESQRPSPKASYKHSPSNIAKLHCIEVGATAFLVSSMHYDGIFQLDYCQFSTDDTPDPDPVFPLR
jgi:hypothetical protein